MNKLDKDYQALLQHIIDNGKPKGDRTGTGTLSVFDYKITHDMSTGFPLLTTKKMYWKGIVTELLWFLRGDTNIKYLVDNDCHIWNGDAYKNYEKEFEKGNAPGRTLLVQRVDGEKTTRKLSMEDFVLLIKTDDEFAKKWGELGPIYGKQWRSWGKNGKLRMKDSEGNRFYGEIKQIDQIANLIRDLKTNPDSRRIIVSAWNVGELDQMTLPPCHWAFELYTEELTVDERIEISTFWYKDDVREQLEKSTTDTTTKYVLDKLDKQGVPKYRLHLKWHQRSVDTFLGLPFNIASYGLLLEILSKAVNMVPGTLVGDLTNVHLYNNHIEQAKEQIGRTSFELPKLKIVGYPDEYECPNDIELFNDFDPSDFEIENYQSHPTIKAPLSN